MSEVDPEDSGLGHYYTAGFAIQGMSVVGLILWICTILGLAKPGFIDATGIFGISTLLFLTGFWMTSVGSPKAGK